MIILDLETQSFSVESGIYEVACLAVKNYEIVGELYLGIPIEGYTGTNKYGYGFYDISSHQESITTFRNFLNQFPYPLVAHNCSFDKMFLDYYGWVGEEKRDYYCSIRAIRAQEKGLKSYALGNLILHYNLGDGAEHTAFEDVEKTLEILKIIQPQTWYKVGERATSGRSYQKKSPQTIAELKAQYEFTKILAGEVICFTGRSSFTRKEMEEIALINGARIAKGVADYTTMLVVGENAGSKLDRAQEFSINIVSDKDFMDIVGENLVHKAKKAEKR